jgi:redox-sensitive bicupin YhaK (pirin superfamily)
MKNTQNIRIRRSEERGRASHGWLESQFSFSFADYYDPEHMGFRTLRVINEDYVAAGQGFGSHPHKDMEILTYVLEGAVAHKDSMGNSSVIKAGEVQKMSAGSGIVHSEFNPSKTEKLHLLQIWIIPQTKDITPNYEQYALPKPDDKNPLQLIASPQGGKNNIIKYYQDAELYRGLLNKGASASHAIRPQRGVWLQMIKGKLDVNGQALKAGDAVAVENEKTLELRSQDDAEFLLFDLK